MDLVIRPACREDGWLVADISRQTFYETFAAHNTAADMELFLDEQFTRGRLMLEVGEPGLYFFLAYANGKLAGYLKLREGNLPASISNKNALEIARIYVLAAYAGKGLGKALMEKSIEVGKQLHKQALWLGVWEKNARAIDFYTSWGFKRFGEQEFLLGNDVQQDWLMEKIL